MGTDIHMYVESWDTEQMRWKPAIEPFADLNFKGDEEYPSRKYRWPALYSERNYDLFAILAGVRNGIGFAGVDRGERFDPIHEPRDLPDDLSDEYRRASESTENGSDLTVEERSDPLNAGLWFGYHDESWATLAEILEYDWLKPHVSRGYVRFEDWVRFQWDASFAVGFGGAVAVTKTAGYDGAMLGLRPQSWCGDTNGPKVDQSVFRETLANLRKLNPRADSTIAFKHSGSRSLAELAVDDLTGNPNYDGYKALMASIPQDVRSAVTHLSWAQTPAQCAGNFWLDSIPTLLKLANDIGGPRRFENVRIVYGFDS
jgi:hypothetical protein